jgi:hypothetical protein
MASTFWFASDGDEWLNGTRRLVSGSGTPRVARSMRLSRTSPDRADAVRSWHPNPTRNPARGTPPAPETARICQNLRKPYCSATARSNQMANQRAKANVPHQHARRGLPLKADLRSPTGEEPATSRGSLHKHARSGGGFRYDEAAVDSLFPDRKPWARRAPGVHNLRVGSRLVCHPFDKVKDQRIKSCVLRRLHQLLSRHERGCLKYAALL